MNFASGQCPPKPNATMLPSFDDSSNGYYMCRVPVMALLYSNMLVPSCSETEQLRAWSPNGLTVVEESFRSPVNVT